MIVKNNIMYKLNLLLYAVVVVLLLLCSCKNNSKNVSNEHEYIDKDTVVYDEIEKLLENDGNCIWYRYKIGGKVGALDKNKNVLIEAQYDFLYFDDKIEMFIGKIGEKVEVIKENGIVFVPVSRDYERFSKEDLGNGDNRYYYEVVRRGLYGICDKNGNEVIVPKFSYLNYEDKYDDARFHDDATNPIGLYGSFYTKDNNENIYIFDIYIDGNGKCLKLNGKRWTRYYKSSYVMSMDDGSCFSSNEKSTIRYYGNYLMSGYEKYYVIEDYTGTEKNSLLARIVNLDGWKCYVDEDIHTYIERKYMREWEKIKDVSISDFYGQENRTSDSNRSISTPKLQQYENIYIDNNISVDTKHKTSKNRVKIWHDCALCNGSGTIVYDTNPPLYGQQDYLKYCSTCQRSFMASCGHTHITCRQCHGRKGYYTESYQ